MGIPTYRSTRAEGFSLLELVVVLTLLMVMTMMVMPVFKGALSDAEVEQSMRDMHAMIKSARSLAMSEGNEYRIYLHPKENLEKMASGTPLTDSERRPWLERVRSYLDKATDQGRFTVMACSALRRSYAELLTRRRPHFRLAVLRVDPKLLAERLLQRKEHFFPAQLLSSQLAILELPPPDEVFDGSKPAQEVALAIIKRYGLADDSRKKLGNPD